MQTEEPPNDSISMLEQAIVAGRPPPRTSVSCLHSHLQPCKPCEEQQQQGQPPKELENRHG